jgi:hypothetical protein
MIFRRTFRLDNRDELVAAMLRDIASPPPDAARIRAVKLAA